jgi:dTDP-4-amino-4,6-dideoxygalactose transaminase
LTLRAQLPVHSPLPFGALAAGVRAAMDGGRGAADGVEALLRAEYAPRELLLTDSGTSALALALSLSAAERPGPVALPAFCCYDIATAVDAAGVPFVLYDVDPATLGPDFDSLRRVLASGARTVVVAHLYGIPVDLGAAMALADEFGVAVVEDAAQGVGARWRGRTLGTVGRYGVLSFGRGKGVTGGGGGALLANTPDAAAALRMRTSEVSARRPGLRLAAATAAQWLLARPSVYGVPSALPFLGLGETIYRAPRPPARPALFTLGVLSRTLRDTETETSIRKAHARRLLAAIGASPELRGYRAPAGAEAGYLRFPLFVASKARGRFEVPAARRLGIWPSYPRSLADLPGFGERKKSAETCAGARELAAALVTLPTHGRLQERDLRGLEQLISQDLKTAG